ncbi:MULTISPECIES: hypothetical protein [Actinosynnema]|uniref:hypothetical protein n=1 Tax=Actinosynnema TaxID=40566 RepID=UPI0020A34881|nr:hypothetical protein [Actinosynnema pretiosum]MCP2095031.1 hypothetical protein [Actinosynnema pretiosum]
MSDGTTSTVLARRWSAWPLTIVVNGVLGYFGAVPLLVFATVIAELAGLSTPDFTGADDSPVVLILIGPVASALVFGLFAGVNYVLWRFGRFSARWHWPLSVLVLLAPAVLALLRPDVWNGIAWG